MTGTTVQHQRGTGFTLIEVLIVITIIGVLSAVVVFAVGSKLKQARDADRETDLHEIRIGLEQYFLHESRYPDALVFNTQPLTSADGSQIFLPRVHHDPVNVDPYLYVYNATPSGDATSYDLCAWRLEAKKASFCVRNLQR